jgi:deubiquitinase DESI2
MDNCVARYGEPVYLNIYDIYPFNDFLHPIGLGFYHTGIEIHGIEYIYGMGIAEILPKEDIEFAKFRESIELGRVKLFNNQIRNLIYNLEGEFNSDNYNPVLKNCNDFSNTVSRVLLDKEIPSYINRWANTGKTLYNFCNNMSGSCNNKYIKCSPFSGKKHNLK